MFNLLNQDYSNHGVLQRNRKPARTHFIPCSTEEKARQCGYYGSDRMTLLNGEWFFEWFSSALDVTQEVIASRLLHDTITVPLNWQFAGFGKICYTDLWYPFPVDPPYIPADNEVGVYKRSFAVADPLPASLSVRFEGVESAFHLYCNGHAVGYSQGSRMPSEFELTPYLQAGQNELCVVVYQYSDATYLEDQDMMWLGGIIRDVYLIERCEGCFENIILDPDWDLKKGLGVLNLTAQATGGAHIGCAVYDGDRLLKRFEKLPNGQRIRLELTDVLPWTAETPNCYTVTVTLYAQDGAELESAPFCIGLRHVEIKNGDFLLNGQRILMKGVNRHEYDCKKGRVVSYEQTKQALLQIKSGAMNAVRTSHYPNNPFFYDLCNQLGLYVMDECDLETHGFEIIDQRTRLCNDPSWEAAYLDRVERMVQRDRNHACVVMWSLGNESYFGDNFRSMYNWCKANEPTRPVHYQEDFKNEIVDVSSTMYSTVGALKELDSNLSPKRPHIHCEFAHAMGNGPGSFKEYFEVMENSQRIQGMFVWEYADQGVYHRRPDGREEYLFGGEFGEKFHNGNFCMDGMIMATGQPSPAFYEYRKVIENAHVLSFDSERMTFVLKNRFDFLSFDKVRCVARVLRDNKQQDSFEVALPLLLPHEVREVALGRRPDCGDGNALVSLQLTFYYTEATAWSVADEQIGDFSVVLQDYTAQPAVASGALRFEQQLGRIVVQGDDFDCYISLTDGRIRNYRWQGQMMMPEGPMLNLYRAFIDNDVKNAAMWNQKHLHSMQMTVHTADCAMENNRLIVRLQGRFAPRAMEWGVKLLVTYTFLADGAVNVGFAGDFDGAVPTELPKLGAQLRLAKMLDSVTYCGCGTDENYCDSSEHSTYGIYTQKATDMSVDYPCPQENGNRTGVRFAVLSGGDCAMAIGCDRGMDFAVRDVEDDDLQSCHHSCDLTHLDYLVVNCDLKNSGLGSGACGPAAMEQYKVFPLRFQHSFALTPAATEDTLAQGRRAIDCNATCHD